MWEDDSTAWFLLNRSLSKNGLISSEIICFSLVRNSILKHLYIYIDICMCVYYFYIYLSICVCVCMCTLVKG